MKFKNLILTILLAGMLTPSADGMKRKLIADDGSPIKKAKTEIDDAFWLPQDMLVHIFTFCLPFLKAQGVLNLMYTSRNWYHALINSETGNFHDNVANIF